MATTREEATVRLGLDTTKLEHQMEGFAHGFSHSLSHYAKEWGAALTVGGIAVGIERILEKFDTLQKESENLGVGVEFLQGIQQVSRTNVVDGIAKVSRSLIDLSTKLGEAKSGNKEALAAFEKFGITAEQIANGNVEEIFFLIADRLKAIPDPAIRAAAAFELLGKAGKQMAGFLSQGSEELKKQVDAVQKLDEEQVKALAESKKHWEDFGNSLSVVGGKIIANIIEPITKGIPEMLAELATFNLRNPLGRQFYDSGNRAAPSISEIAKLHRELKEAQIKNRLDEKMAAFRSIQDIANAQRAADQSMLERQLANLRILVAEKQKQVDRERHLQGSFSDRFMPSHDEILKSSRYGNLQAREDFLEDYVKNARLNNNLTGVRNGMAEIQRIDMYLDRMGVKQDPMKELRAEFEKLTGLSEGNAMRVLIKNID